MEFIKSYFHLYELKLKNSSAKRIGALLKAEKARGQVGYCDLHPWTELGDTDLKTLLALLGENNWSHPLLQQAKYFLAADCEARTQKRNLVSGINYPQSHFLAPSQRLLEDGSEVLANLDRALTQGFKKFKIKGPLDFENKAHQNMIAFFARLQIQQPFLRFDLNLKSTPLEAENFFKGAFDLGLRAESIEFVEDPFKGTPDQWNKFSAKLNVSLAQDWWEPELTRLGSEFESHWQAPYKIIKPSRDSIQKTLTVKNQKIVITTSLDHALGVSAAHFYTSQLLNAHVPIEACGLLSHGIYESDSFYDAIEIENARLKAIPGTGLGFDEQLVKLDWTSTK